MFDTINGLPVHALVVHGVVVLLPLMSLITVLVALRERWRQAAGFWVVVANTVVLVLSYVAAESGERLQSRLSQLSGSTAAEQHGEWGDMLPYFAFAVLVASAVVYWAASRGGKLVPISIVLAVICAVAAIGWTIRVGDSGAKSVWEDTIQNTPAPVDD